MKTYINQMIDLPAEGESNVLHTVKYREDVVAFRFPSVRLNAKMNTFVHGVTVDARHVWAAIFALHCTPNKAVLADGSEVWCGEVVLQTGDDWRFYPRELRLGADAKYGPTAARIERQQAWAYADEATGAEEAQA